MCHQRGAGTTDDVSSGASHDAFGSVVGAEDGAGGVECWMAAGRHGWYFMKRTLSRWHEARGLETLWENVQD